eukprot:CAMPEP_0203682778 /NCGR_PEP_ID=MMETSP0090-20130426/47099_1 /ASSEMBLY_ACC=CAM_ASM_001088 /TAXON_ID=426623 /ORGANISM="Chaetoceros affinis, Strain CCMP159" /LENGTH=542 /DNA_ID=CAMNT_0050551881 /DNA_START=395 /DNA_END=2019 /DNA_ORIENTATION=-
MARNTSINKNTGSSNDKPKKANGPIIGVDSNTEGGGVWAQQSAKRDKLGELKMELKFDLGQRTLDDLASEEEKYDLYLVDGVACVMRMVDCGGIYGDLNLNLNTNTTVIDDDGEGEDGSRTLASASTSGPAGEILRLMKEFEESIPSSPDITKEQFDAHLENLIERVSEIRSQHPAAVKGQGLEQITRTTTNNSNDTNMKPQQQQQQKSITDNPLVHIRDFLFYDQPNPDKPAPPKLRNEMMKPISEPFIQCYEYFQLTLLQTALEHLLTQWEDLTKISSGDQDRAATSGETLSSSASINVLNLHSVLQAFASGSCSDRVEALWDLMDKDHDGLLDQEEMDKVALMSVEPVQNAVKVFIEESIDIWPLRKWGLPPPCLEGYGQGDGEGLEVLVGTGQKKKLGFYKRWKERRHEKKAKQALLKMVDRTIKNHFDVEVETPHRLRCIYAWAEKAHQDGKTESVLVDTTDNASTNSGFLGGGRKRYVELDPKISYSEFRAVQSDHFSHLDRIGQELCTSLKEDLWVHQGKGRQNQELKREAAAFL